MFFLKYPLQKPHINFLLKINFVSVSKKKKNKINIKLFFIDVLKLFNNIKYILKYDKIQGFQNLAEKGLRL